MTGRGSVTGASSGGCESGERGLAGAIVAGSGPGGDGAEMQPGCAGGAPVEADGLGVAGVIVARPAAEDWDLAAQRGLAGRVGEVGRGLAGMAGDGAWPVLGGDRVAVPPGLVAETSSPVGAGDPGVGGTIVVRPAAGDGVAGQRRLAGRVGGSAAAGDLGGHGAGVATKPGPGALSPAAQVARALPPVAPAGAAADPAADRAASWRDRAPGSGAGRMGWIDAARGIGIVLVVAGHALGGVIDSPLGAGVEGLRPAFFAIYTFHMPLFLVLAGLLVPPRVARGPGRFIGGAARTVAWPYFLWSAVQFSVIVAAGSLVNRPAGAWLPTILALPWRTVSQFWFLYALFWMHVVAALVLPRGGVRGLLVLAVAARLAAAFIPMDVTVRLVLGNLVWYALGAWIGADGVRAMARRFAAGGSAAAGLAVAALVVAGAVIAVTFALLPIWAPDRAMAEAASPAIANLAWRLPVLPAALVGCAAVLCVASMPRLA